MYRNIITSIQLASLFFRLNNISTSDELLSVLTQLTQRTKDFVVMHETFIFLSKKNPEKLSNGFVGSCLFVFLNEMNHKEEQKS